MKKQLNNKLKNLKVRSNKTEQRKRNKRDRSRFKKEIEWENEFTKKENKSRERQVRNLLQSKKKRVKDNQKKKRRRKTAPKLKYARAGNREK